MKKLISIILVLAMAFSLVFSTGVTAFAEGTETPTEETGGGTGGSGGGDPSTPPDGQGGQTPPDGEGGDTPPAPPSGGTSKTLSYTVGSGESLAVSPNPKNGDVTKVTINGAEVAWTANGPGAEISAETMAAYAAGTYTVSVTQTKDETEKVTDYTLTIAAAAGDEPGGEPGDEPGGESDPNSGMSGKVVLDWTK